MPSSSVEQPLSEQILRVLGISTRVLHAGSESDREAIVFIHGAPGSADDWREIMPAAGAVGRVLAFDLAGFGNAERLRGFEYSPSGWATFIAAALSELAVTRVHAVASDLGAISTVLWAAAHREAVASITVIGSGVPVGYRWHVLARAERTPFVGRVVSAAGRLGFRPVMSWVEPGLSGEVLKRWRGGYDRGARRALLRFYRATDLSRLELIAPVLSRLDIPALVIWGERDKFVPVGQAERQRHSLRNAELAIFEDLGHYPHVEDPQAVAAELVPFLERATA